MFSEITEFGWLYIRIFVYQLPRNNDDIALSLEKIYLPRRPVVFVLKLYIYMCVCGCMCVWCMCVCVYIYIVLYIYIYITRLVSVLLLPRPLRGPVAHTSGKICDDAPSGVGRFPDPLSSNRP